MPLWDYAPTTAGMRARPFGLDQPITHIVLVKTHGAGSSPLVPYAPLYDPTPLLLTCHAFSNRWFTPDNKRSGEGIRASTNYMLTFLLGDLIHECSLTVSGSCQCCSRYLGYPLTSHASGIIAAVDTSREYFAMSSCGELSVTLGSSNLLTLWAHRGASIYYARGQSISSHRRVCAGMRQSSMSGIQLQAFLSQGTYSLE